MDLSVSLIPKPSDVRLSSNSSNSSSSNSNTLTINSNSSLSTRTSTDVIQNDILKQELCSIIGSVVNKEWKKGEKNSLLHVLSISSQRIYKIICPFFCPSRVGDAISGMCTNLPDGKLIFLKEPLVEPGSSEDTIKTSFIIAMKGIGSFGKLKADKLLSMSVQHTISQQNDFFFIVRSACFTYTYEVSLERV